MPVALQQSLEPHHVPAGFHSHYRPCRQAGVELLHLLTQMLDPTIRQHFAACALDHEHLLSTRMKITAYNQHRLAPFARAPWSFKQPEAYGGWEPSSLSNQGLLLAEGSPGMFRACLLHRGSYTKHW